MAQARKKVITNKLVIAELKQISAENNGVLSPDKVVAFARNPDSALHNKFEWDNSVAAQKWRLHQARNLIEITVVLIGVEKRPIRIFASLTTDRKKGDDGGYRAVVDILSNKRLYQQLLMDAKAEMDRFCLKYAEIKELKSVIKQMKAVVDKI